MSQITVHTLQKLKQLGRKITMVTAYDFPTARTIDQLPEDSQVDAILVGDSLGMTVLGYDSTIKVTMADMVHHSAAVARGTTRALIVTDMPFLSYHVSVADTVRNAGLLVQSGGAHAVKMEGGLRILPHVQAVLETQIPVIGHLGLTPQSINALGGWKVQGKTAAQAESLLTDALALQNAGVSAIVLECIPADLSKHISEELTIPTIGIGAGPGTDGQVLVLHDLAGLYSPINPKFVRRFGETEQELIKALCGYTTAVREQSFPTIEHSF